MTISDSDLLITLFFISILTLFAAPLGEFMAKKGISWLSLEKDVYHDSHSI